MHWYIQAFKNYVNFSGRARRSEYWYFVLFNVIVCIAIGIVDGVIIAASGGAGFGILGLIYNLAVILPSIALATRRLHDIGKSGWWQLIVFIPIIGVIVLIVFYVKDSVPGDNQYGPNPKEDLTAITV